MLAALYRGLARVGVEDVPTPAPGSGEILVKVLVTGVCGSDAAEYRDGPHLVPLHTAHPVTGHRGPVVLGHEFVGEVVDPGRSGLATGRRVVTGAGVACGTCPRCRDGRTNLCATYSTVGLHRHGGLAQFCTVPASICLPVPDDVPTDVAAMTQPMAVAVHAAARGKVSAGERVLIVGAGGIGAFLTCVVAERGAETAVLEPDPQRRRLAEVLGASHSLDLAGASPPDGEFDVVFEVSGSETGMRAALNAARAGGRVILVGLQHRPGPALTEITLRELDLIGTMALVHRTDVAEALGLLGRDSGRWLAVAPTVQPLSQVDARLRQLAGGTPDQVKNLFDPWITSARPFRPIMEAVSA